MNITIDVVTADRNRPEIAASVYAAVPPALLEIVRSCTVVQLDALRVFAGNVAEAALSCSGRKLSSVGIVLSSGN